ncbi:MAG: orotidine-5'-phosphate decarboxylase [Blastocatellia bacterium]|nr:orotidine-5'-phosphate decarboxylase [Blastocatellia bacterium]
MTETSTQPRNRLVIALDVETRANACALVDQLRELVGWFKIGSQLFTAEGPELVRELVRRDVKVFLDLKFHDIPSTVAKAGIEATRLGVAMFNVHAMGGAEMMRAVADAVSEMAEREGLQRPVILAVTLLTSLGPNDVKQIFIAERIENVVTGLARLASESGLDGVVCSPQEAMLIRHHVNRPDFVILTPGIRPSWAAAQDQKRVLTPTEALQEGADYIVVGRPVTDHADPAAAARRILEEIEAFERQPDQPIGRYPNYAQFGPRDY